MAIKALKYVLITSLSLSFFIISAELRDQTREEERNGVREKERKKKRKEKGKRGRNIQSAFTKVVLLVFLYLLMVVLRSMEVF